MREFRSLPVPEGLQGMRVDAGVSRLFGISRAAAAELATAGDVVIGGTPAGKSSRLRPGDWLEVTLPEPPAPLAQEDPEEVAGMEILYADADVIALNKPVGVAAHPTVGWEGPTVTAGLKAAGFRISTSGPPERKGIVQRLDVGTSGVMIVAASERGYSKLKRAFRERTVKKTYHALVQGHPDPFTGTIDAPIARHPKHGWRFAVVNDGKPAITHYRTLEAFPAATLLEVHLETGRTHQIRVHMASLRHPCVGDPMYGGDPVLAAKLGLNHQWLHAVSLAFEHPATGEEMEITAPYPADLTRALEAVRR